jgi:hypothetical protein
MHDCRKAAKHAQYKKEIMSQGHSIRHNMLSKLTPWAGNISRITSVQNTTIAVGGSFYLKQ